MFPKGVILRKTVKLTAVNCKFASCAFKKKITILVSFQHSNTPVIWISIKNIILSISQKSIKLAGKQWAEDVFIYGYKTPSI